MEIIAIFLSLWIHVGNDIYEYVVKYQPDAILGV